MNKKTLYILLIILVCVIAILIIKLGSPTETKIKILPIPYLDFFEFTWKSCEFTKPIVEEKVEEVEPKIKVSHLNIEGDFYKGNNLSAFIKIFNYENLTYNLSGEWINLYDLYDKPIIEKHCKNSSFNYININDTIHSYQPRSCPLDKTGTWKFDVKILYDKSIDRRGIEKYNKTFVVSELR